MEITINQQVIERLAKEGFYPDNMMSSLFALQALAQDYALLDIWDDFNKSRRAIVLYYDLVDKGLWENDPASPLHFKTTPKGDKLIAELKRLSGKQEVSEWIQDYINLFPKGVSPGGKLLRSDAKDILPKMMKFIKKYGYSPDIILKATKEYLDERKLQDYAYTKAAIYFIDKQGEGSALAARCAEVGNKPEEKESSKQVFI